MHWIDWVIIVFLALGALITVGEIDKPRARITHTVGALVVLIDALLIIGLLLTHT